jgi:anti-anti-sigma factor
MIAIENEKIDEITAVSIKGRLDSVTAPEMETHCRALIEKGETRILIDLDGLEYISSAGLRVLLVIAKSVKAKSGTLVLCRLAPIVREVMEISGFDKIFEMAGTREEALARF